MSKPLLRSKAPRKRRHRQSHHVLGSKSSFDSHRQASLPVIR